MLPHSSSITQRILERYSYANAHNLPVCLATSYVTCRSAVSTGLTNVHLCKTKGTLIHFTLLNSSKFGVVDLLPAAIPLPKTHNSREKRNWKCELNRKQAKIFSIDRPAHEHATMITNRNILTVSILLKLLIIKTLSTGLLNCLNARSRGLNFRHRASCIQGQAFRYSPENAFYIFNQQIYFIV